MVFLIVAIICAIFMYKFMDDDTLGIVFSVGFVISVTLVLGQLGMESLLLRLILAAAAWFVLGMIFEGLPAESSRVADGTKASGTSPKGKQAVSPTPSALNIDNDYFLIKDGRLLKWRGESDNIVVPDGVRIIGSGTTRISRKTIDTIWIPKSVWRIDDCALPFVESVYYEGSRETLDCKEYNFNADGWIADWSKKDKYPYRVNEVKFHFNDTYYQALADKHFKEHPEQLQPRSSTQQATSAPARTGLSPFPSDVDALVDETIDIVNEIFDISGIAYLLSDIDYAGAVLVVPTFIESVNRKTAEYRFTIMMLNVSDLEACRNKNIRWKNDPNNHEQNAKLFAFTWKYRNNYNSSRNLYEINTKATAQISKDKLPELKAHIKDQITKRCEMAYYCGDNLHHKKLYDMN